MSEDWDPSENCYCGGTEEIYPHRRGTGYYCRRSYVMEPSGPSNVETFDCPPWRLEMVDEDGRRRITVWHDGVEVIRAEGGRDMVLWLLDEALT